MQKDGDNKLGDMSDERILEQLLKIKDRDTINYLASYKVEPAEMYYYFYGYRFLCECSYEMQCAVWDIDGGVAYSTLVDSYFISKSADLRWDRDMKFIRYPSDFDVHSFIQGVWTGR